MTIQLQATNARKARLEAQRYAPCKLNGYNKNNECVFLSCVRAHGDKSYVATARRGNEIAVKFEAITDKG